MVYTIERRKARCEGSLVSFYQVRAYEGRSRLGCLYGGETITETKTKKEAQTFCETNGIKWEEQR